MTNSLISAYLENYFRYSKGMSVAFYARQVAVAFPGDPLAGKLLPGSKVLNWNDATETQKAIFEYHVEGGLKFPDDYDTILAENQGPNLPWNLSYSQWGVDKPQAA